LDMLSDRVLKPAVAAVANKIDFDGLTMAKNNTANIVGTAGTPPTSLLTYLTAGAYLDSEGAPRDGRRSCIVEPFTGATIVDSLKGLFVPSDVIGKQYQKGMMGRDSAGMNWKMDQNVVNQTFGSYTDTLSTNTTTFTGSLTTGWASTSSITLVSSAGTATLNQGDVIQIAGVYAVNPQNRSAYGSGKLRNFVVTTAVTVASGGGTSVTVSPAIITAGQFQNVTIIGSTSTTAVVTPFNKSGTVSPQNLVMHRNAFCLATADLELPDGVVFAGRASDKELGLSLRVVRQYTINNDSIPTRVDVLYGWAPLYPELACRVAA
jgi:hypothetical protein